MYTVHHSKLKSKNICFYDFVWNDGSGFSLYSFFVLLSTTGSSRVIPGKCYCRGIKLRTGCRVQDHCPWIRAVLARGISVIVAFALEQKQAFALHGSTARVSISGIHPLKSTASMTLERPVYVPALECWNENQPYGSGILLLFFYTIDPI